MNNIILEKMNSTEEVPVNIFSKLLQNRIIFIDDLYTDKAATGIVAALLFLDSQEQANIKIFINCEGGDIRNVFAVYDTIRCMQSTIETYCIGSAMREVVLLLAAGTKGYRFLTKHANVAVSQLASPYISYADLVNTEISHNKNIKDNESFLRELSLSIGKSIAVLKKDAGRQFFLNASQAVKYGIADKVL